MIDHEALRVIAKKPHRLGWVIGKEKLTPLHSEWIKYCWDSDGPRALQAFRGGYKTTAITLIGSIVWMLFHPNDRIAIIRKTFRAAADVLRAIGSAMEREEIKALFKLAHGAPLRAERERTAELVREIQTNIIEPGKGSAWIGTPWHRDDAWSVIRGFCPIARYPISKYNFIGEKEAERKRLTTTPFLYQANYELQIGNDEASLFSDPVYSSGWDHSRPGALAHIDAAYDGDHYCALTIAAPIRKEGDNQFYQIAGFTYPGNVKDWIDEIARLCRKYRAGAIYTETNPDKGYTADKLRGRGLRVKDYAERMNKHLKISTHLYNVWPYLEWAPETDEEYLSQVTDYREGAAPDDAPDSAASLFREAFSKNNTAWLSRWEW